MLMTPCRIMKTPLRSPVPTTLPVRLVATHIMQSKALNAEITFRGMSVFQVGDAALQCIARLFVAEEGGYINRVVAVANLNAGRAVRQGRNGYQPGRS